MVFSYSIKFYRYNKMNRSYFYKDGSKQYIVAKTHPKNS